MRRFWSFIVAPVLRDRAPGRIVEVGSQSGESTARLLELARELDAHLDVIDPLPMANLEQIRPLLDAHGTFHRALSLDALPHLPAAEAYLLDGDHNWYTVFNELALIHAATAEAPDPGPVIILHDVGWPYGRRDLYYDLDRVPAAGRQPIVQGGLRQGRDEVVPEDGMNAHLHHADHEGGPHNGVRTAVEDFLGARAGEYRFESVPAINGLGFIFRASAAATPFAARIQAFCALDPAHLALIETMERERLASGLAVEERRRLHHRDVQILTAQLAARDEQQRSRAERLKKLEARLEEITGSRAYRAVQKLQAARRALRPKRR